jgi:hypothetical protein
MSKISKTEEKKPKGPAGRPTDFKPEYVDLAYKFSLLGATDIDLAKFFDVSEDTIYSWKKVHNNFSEAIKDGKERADANVSSRLYSRAMGYSHEAVKIFADPKTGSEHIVKFTEHYPPDTAAAIFWLKNRQRGRWRDRIDQEVTGPDGGELKTTLTIKFENPPEPK